MAVKQSGKKPSDKSGCMTFFYIIGFLTILVGLAMLYAVFTQVSFTFAAVSGTGTVINTEEKCRYRDNGERYCSDYPVVEFRTPDEQLHRFTSAYGTTPDTFTRGESVDVLYNADDPAQAEIAANLDFLRNPLLILLTLTGLVLCLIGGAFVIGMFKRRK